MGVVLANDVLKFLGIVAPDLPGLVAMEELSPAVDPAITITRAGDVVTLALPDPAGTDAFRIFDGRGRLVREVPATEGVGRWDLRDRRGHRVASGVYFVRADGVTAQRFALIR